MKDFFLKYRVFFNYIGVGYLGVILNIILNILIMRFFDPVVFGKITLGKSIFQSYEFSHLGTRFGLDRLLPHTNELKRRNFIFSSCFYFTLISSCLLSSFWLVYDINNLYFYSFFILSGVFSALSTLYRVFYRSDINKSIFVSISAWILVFPIVLQIVSVYFFGINGLLYSNLISYLICFLICSVKYKIDLRINYRLFKDYLTKTFSIGFFLFLSSIVSFLALVGDRFIIAKYWGFGLLGDYSVIMFFFTAFTTLAVSYTEMIMNRIIVNPSFAFIIKQLGIVLGISLLFVLISIPILPYFIDYFTPKYSYLVPMIRLILLGAVSYCFMPILNYYLHAKDKRREMLIINISSSVIYFIGLYVVMINFKSLEYLVYLKILSFVVMVGITFILFLYLEKKNK